MSRYFAKYNGFSAELAAVQAFAWSAPMRDLAKLIGISDVALRKHFNKLGIVTPPQGHWNRVAAGRQGASRPAIPPRRPGETGRVRLDERYRDYVPEASEWPTDGPFSSAVIPEDLEELRARELLAIRKVKVPRDLSRPAAGLAHLLRREEELRRKAAADRWAWRKPHFEGALDQRRLRILSALFMALAERGHSGEAYEYDGELQVSCTIGDMRLGLELTATGKHRYEMRGGRRLPAADLPASTPLRLSHSHNSPGDGPSGWQDDETGLIESRIGEIAAHLIVLGEATFRRSLVERDERRERERLKQEAERRRHIAELEARRIADLEESGVLLRRAGELRGLVAQVKRAVDAGDILAGAIDVDRWERWALAQADRLDPVLSGQVFKHLHVPELDDPNEAT